MDWLCTNRVHLPHNDGGVFGACGQFCAVVGELAEPNLVTVLCQDLLGVTGELLSKQTETQTGSHCI